MPIQTVNPNTNKSIKSFEEMTDSALDAAVAQSVKTYENWKKTNYKKRADLLHKTARLMRDKKNRLRN